MASARFTFPGELIIPINNFISGSLHDLQLKLGLIKGEEGTKDDAKKPVKEMVVQIHQPQQSPQDHMEIPYHNPGSSQQQAPQV